MRTTFMLLSCAALSLAQGPERADWQLTPRLASGLELVYRGTYSEESLIPNAQHQTQYRIETSVLVLETALKDWQVAVMTALTLQAAEKKEGPASVSLDVARIDLQGRLRNADKHLVRVPLKGPPTFETGFLAPAPPQKIGKNAVWDVNDDKLPTQRWQAVGAEAVSGLTCIKVVGIQQSDDWDRPRADQTAWRRRDTIWLHPQLMVAQKVERIIERRDPARDMPTSRTVVRYEMDQPVQYPGLLFEDRRKDVLKANKFHEDAQLLLKQPNPNRQQIDNLIQRVSFHLDRQPAGQATPYRKAVVHIRAVLEKAQKGELPIQNPTEDPPAPARRTLGIGDRVPDFAVSSLTEEKTARLKTYEGKPVVVIFYNPSTQLGKEVMSYAKQLSTKHTSKLGVLAMAVTQEPDVARKQHKEMGLAFPILDGNGMRLTFGVEQTPRFVVVDGAGLVRLTLTGWGYPTPIEIEDVLQKCLPK